MQCNSNVNEYTTPIDLVHLEDEALVLPYDDWPALLTAWKIIG